MEYKRAHNRESSDNFDAEYNDQKVNSKAFPEISKNTLLLACSKIESAFSCAVIVRFEETEDMKTISSTFLILEHKMRKICVCTRSQMTKCKLGQQKITGRKCRSL